MFVLVICVYFCVGVDRKPLVENRFSGPFYRALHIHDDIRDDPTRPYTLWLLPDTPVVWWALLEGAQSLGCRQRPLGM